MITMIMGTTPSIHLTIHQVVPIQVAQVAPIQVAQVVRNLPQALASQVRKPRAVRNLPQALASQARKPRAVRNLPQALASQVRNLLQVLQLTIQMDITQAVINRKRRGGKTLLSFFINV